MKDIFSLLVGIMVFLPVSAQTLTIRFDGNANSNNTQARYYVADVDGRKYSSSNVDVTTNASARQITINDVALGSHKLVVYEADANSNISNTNLANPIYSNTFQLRNGYDMVVAVRKNGQVSFSEKKMNPNTASVANAAMTETEFDKLLKKISGKWSQTSRYNDVKAAFANKSYYFTTDQAGQLLLLVTSEAKRLELAKLSYPKITDPNNFGDVSDLFKVQSNKDNINNFIQSKNQATISTTGIDNSRPPISTQQFNQLQRQIKNQYEQSGKYAVLRDALNSTTNYFTTAQLKQLLPLITTENDRLVLAKQSYPRVSDVANFSSLNTLFTTQANKDEFNNYVKYGETSTSQATTRTPMSDGNFTKLQLKARLHFSQSSTVKEIKTALTDQNNYFTLDQLRSLLSLVSSEADRLALAKLAYPRAVDPTTFTQLYDLFTSQASINELNTYIKSNPS